MSWGTWSDRWKMVDWEIQDYDAFLADKERIQLFCGWNPARMRRLKEGDEKQPKLLGRFAGDTLRLSSTA